MSNNQEYWVEVICDSKVYTNKVMNKLLHLY